MAIKIESRFLRDVVVLVPDIFWEDQFQAHGLPTHFVQDNHSRSTLDTSD
jgi:dTDP-4-dehydrorhamnose 3,5-epimerase-like enzyme